MNTGISCKLNQGYEDNTIAIHVENINFIDYNIDHDTKDQLFIQGFKSVVDIF